jgi:hypothetical protein
MTSISVSPAATVGLLKVTVSIPPLPSMTTVALLAKRMLSNAGALTCVVCCPFTNPPSVTAMASLPAVPLMTRVAAATVSVIGAMPAKSMVCVPAVPACTSVPASWVAPAV